MFAILALIEQFTGQWAKKGWFRAVPLSVFFCVIAPTAIVFLS